MRHWLMPCSFKVWILMMMHRSGGTPPISESRITQAGEDRVTQSGETRVTQGT